VLLTVRNRCRIAIALVAVLAGCTGGSTTAPIAPGLSVRPVTAASVSIAGVGDALTQGSQSGGTLGVPAANPNAGSLFGPIVPPTQPNGFFALLWTQVNGGVNTTGNPATSPLALMGAPGIGTVLVPSASGVPTPIVALCGGNNTLAFTYSTALQARANPTVTPFDLGVPGQSVHEALFMTGPDFYNCTAASPVVPSAAPFVGNEDTAFYPVLGNFPQGTTQVNAAAQLHAKFATVWLGQNDLLNFTISLGQVAPTDPGQMQSDLVQIIRTLQASGSKVLIANQPPLLSAAVFVPLPGLQSALTALGGAAAGAATPFVQTELQLFYGVGNGGYVTISGLRKILAALVARQTRFALSGGDFVPDALATQVNALNAAYNVSIKSAATQTGAALVDVNASINAIIAAGGLPINPPKCCTLQYGGGMYSLDGLYPSNTGYAVIANVFIATMNSAYGTSFPQVNVAAIYATDPFAPH
jgi:hypothetical protein